jgi:hypothetical protein
MAKANKTKFYAQGDIILELVDDATIDPTKAVPSDPDGSVVLARGETHGHRHRFTGDSGVVMFRDDGLARDIKSGLYGGHVVVPEGGAALVHEEHDSITLPKGTYRMRHQREMDADMERRVLD